MKYEFRKATLEDARYVADHIKEDNLLEMQALIGGHVYEELCASLKNSVVSGCCVVDDKPIALYGLTKRTIVDKEYCVWLLLTDEVEKHKVFIARETKRALRAIVRDFGPCSNVCNAENKRILRWVEWMGGKLYGPYPYGIYGILHYYFEFDESILKE